MTAETEPCSTCGSPLKVRIRHSPLHKKDFRLVAECQRCTEDLARTNEEYRRACLRPGLIRECGIPARWTALSLNGDVYPELVVDEGNVTGFDKLTEWVKSDTSLYVWGSTGSGKTTLAMAALLDCCRDCQEGLFVSEGDLEDDLHAGWDRNLIRRTKEIPVLVLDDIASRPLSEKLMIVYRDIFDRRLLHGLKTLVTGQLPPEAKGDRKGQHSLMNHWRIEAKEGKEGKEGKVREDIASRVSQLLGGNAVEVRGLDAKQGNRRLAVRNAKG